MSSAAGGSGEGGGGGQRRKPRTGYASRGGRLLSSSSSSSSGSNTNLTLHTAAHVHAVCWGCRAMAYYSLSDWKRLLPLKKWHAPVV